MTFPSVVHEPQLRREACNPALSAIEDVAAMNRGSVRRVPQFLRSLVDPEQGRRAHGKPVTKPGGCHLISSEITRAQLAKTIGDISSHPAEDSLECSVAIPGG